MMFSSFYRGRTVLVTGHTGFKGSWLTEWLLALGAEVHGYALDPEPHEVLFDELGLGGRMASDTRANVSDLDSLKKVVAAIEPDLVLHLAAQPLVRMSYVQPVETFATNIMGTVNLLEAVRQTGVACSVVCITTDKCYENQEWLHAYRESDPMGGHDPYSASKGAAELVISSYRRSFFSQDDTVRLASARAGNVIGGGDWARDRIVPDCIRSWRRGEAVIVRNRTSTRPWQHVLEPLSGYLLLGSRLADSTGYESVRTAFNFGPDLASNRTVEAVVAGLSAHLGGDWVDGSDPAAPHEASKLNLATDKAFHLMGWRPVWDFREALAKTAEWYRVGGGCEDPRERTLTQIKAYEAAAEEKGLSWSIGDGRAERPVGVFAE